MPERACARVVGAHLVLMSLVLSPELVRHNDSGSSKRQKRLRTHGLSKRRGRIVVANQRGLCSAARRSCAGLLRRAARSSCAGCCCAAAGCWCCTGAAACLVSTRMVNSPLSPVPAAWPFPASALLRRRASFDRCLQAPRRSPACGLHCPQAPRPACSRKMGKVQRRFETE